SSVIHWYQQKEGQAPVRLLYFTDGVTAVESVFQEERYTVENVPGRNRYVLTISDIVPEDTATYYCAYWDPPLWSTWIKYFGTGTKLIVSNQGNSPPASSEILQKKHDNHITYICLIEKFYPEIIRVKWTDGENKEVTDNMVKGNTWKLPKEDKYSISSWLTVPAENEDKNYYCTYEHESQQRSLPTRGIHTPYAKNVSRLFCLMFVTDHLMHRAAFLVYVVLLLKSSMYYLIVLFFIYR
ncbi:IGK protein, partial [Semnornis frantzii]|nr:IGK protein [Semnornis frantzii]